MKKKSLETFVYLKDRNLFKNSLARSWSDFVANKSLNKSLHRDSIKKGTKKIH